MQLKIAILTILCFFSSCGGKVSSKANDYVGVWKCVDISDGFLDAVGVNRSAYASSIRFKADGTFTARNFPQRDPFRIVDITGYWSIMAGEYTPSGKTSILASGNHLIIQKGISDLKLKNNISGMDRFAVIYEKE